MKAKKEKLLTEDVSTHFSVKNLLKDLTYTYELVRSIRKPAFLNAQVKEIYRMAFSKEVAEEDFSIIYLLRGSFNFLYSSKNSIDGKGIQ